MQNKLDVIQQFIISSSVYLFSIVHARSNVLPDKTESMLSVQVIADIDSETLTAKECRSRYAKFYILSETRDNRHVGRRDREPSRILAKKLSRLLNKNRKLRKLVRKHIKLNVPRSSRIHRLLYAFSHERKKLLNDQVRYLPQVTKKTKCPQESSRRRRKQAATLKTTAFLFKNGKMKYKSYTKPQGADNLLTATCTYKDLNHRINCCKFNLSRDIEKNPGPTQIIDPSKTIHAPYSQGNVDVFGPNAGQQCVAMSLCSLIYNYSNRSINDTEDLVQIMNIGNELYSALSRSSRQTYLLLTELPTMATVLNTNYQLEFSESYSGNLHAATLNENIPYVMPLYCALQSLIQESYNSFLLTIGCNTVSIYIIPNGLLKILDSHARDSFGMAHSHGTCVLLEVN